MVSLWNIVGCIVLVLGGIGSFFMGNVESIIISLLSCVFGGIVCFTVSWGLSRMERITEAVELIATSKPAGITETAQPCRPKVDTVTYPHAVAPKTATWTCKKCLSSNPTTSRYCKECGAYK